MMSQKALTSEPTSPSFKRDGERGVALLMVLLIMALLGAITISVLAVVSTEANVAASDLQRTRTFNVAEAGVEKMTDDFSALFRTKSRPTAADLTTIAGSYPAELEAEGFSFNQSLVEDTAKARRNATVQTGAYAGLQASVIPYVMTTRARMDGTNVEVTVRREMNNYLIPLFQFGTFGDKDLEFWPEPPMTFNGRVHANGNIYFGGDITFLSKVTTANEAVVNKLRNNGTLGYYNNPRWDIPDPSNPSNKINVQLTLGSVTNGPKLTPVLPDGRGNHPGSPTGTDNSSTTWKNNLIAQPVANTPNRFGGYLLTRSTGVKPLQLPLQLDGHEARELIKRRMPDDTQVLGDSRYHTKATIRILIDDESAGTGNTNKAGIPLNKGVALSQFVPIQLNSADGGNALRIITDSGTYANSVDWWQGDPARGKPAQVVRGVRNDYAAAIQATTANANTGGTNSSASQLNANQSNASIPKQPNGAIIPTGAGIKGRIYIEIVKADGTVIDVTTQILSMGMTEGEPNAIIHLQRPLWAAFMQGSRDRKGDLTHHNYLTYFLDNSVTNRRAIADGEVKSSVAFNSTGYIYSDDNGLDDDPHLTTTPFSPNTATMSRDDKTATSASNLNRIVPINVYNVREGRIAELTQSSSSLYQRGIGSVVEINMRNLARWMDGVYDNNLLKGTQAISANIKGDEGYVVYFSDRRGDRVKAERDSAGLNIQTTNGTVDNEDVYNYTASPLTLDPGEDIIDSGFDVAQNLNKKGSLQRDLCELPSPTAIGIGSYTAPSALSSIAARYNQAMTINDWNPAPPALPGACATNYFFRRSLRLFNGEDLVMSGAAGKLSATKGITIASENMVYIWGNYNTTGITGQPLSGSTLNSNDLLQVNRYVGDQVPASIVTDAFFPLSKTWYDSMIAMYPEGANNRIADAGNISPESAILVGQETAVRAGMIAGTTMSAMVGSGVPAYYLQWLNGGVHNYPRFLETWSVSDVWEKRWNYVGSFILLYHSTQAVGPYSVISSVVYSPPKRNWAFDDTFLVTEKLPPGTPMFQYVEPTAFRQVVDGSY